MTDHPLRSIRHTETERPIASALDSSTLLRKAPKLIPPSTASHIATAAQLKPCNLDAVIQPDVGGGGNRVIAPQLLASLLLEVTRVIRSHFHALEARVR